MQLFPVIPLHYKLELFAEFTGKTTHTIHTSGSWRDRTTCAWGCLTLENNGMSSWPCSRVWRAYSPGVGVSNVARLYGCDPGLGGTAGSLPLAARPFSDRCRRVMNYLSGSSRIDVNTWLSGGSLLWCFWKDVMIRSVNTSCGEFISTVLARGVVLVFFFFVLCSCGPLKMSLPFAPAVAASKWK